MTRRELSADTRRFILTSIPSVPYLEAVLLLRTAPGADWDVPSVARRLYVPESRAVELLEAASAAGIFERQRDGNENRYRFHPSTPELAQRIDGLAEAYAEHLVPVTDLIHSRLDKRAQQFADAFRLRKDS
ncbi:MAG TPA: hypothetical protein VHA82_04945 [Ramlibacter sp.]|uniref:hypothetical protein n=1 Tax=Ramlibacter sp. TaxID=1917967 RepID=UPI002CEB396B|nr:hypothetical protein [Ramlibacter sp.]HVZ43137.1 hypothetical protein [Ramlibacter sp.]